MQAIITKAIAPTNTRGPRIKATCDAGSITIAYPSGKDTETGHRMAAEALAAKLEWNNDGYGKMVCGGLPNQAGYVFVFVQE